MKCLSTNTFERDYHDLNAAGKTRVQIALRRLEREDPGLRVEEVDPVQGVRAAFADDFLCITFRPAEAPGAVYLLNVRSTDIAQGESSPP